MIMVMVNYLKYTRIYSLDSLIYEAFFKLKQNGIPLNHFSINNEDVRCNI